MSVATPKQQAKEPIDLDIILVCRKRARTRATSRTQVLSKAISRAANQVSRLNSTGRALSRNDVRIVLTAQVVLLLSADADADAALAWLDEQAAEINSGIERLHAGQSPTSAKATPEPPQLPLFA
jgi:hypothetical protein